MVSVKKKTNDDGDDVVWKMTLLRTMVLLLTYFTKGLTISKASLQNATAACIYEIGGAYFVVTVRWR